MVLEIDNGGPRGGFTPGAELGQALVTLRSARRRLKLSALLCYDALAAANGNPVYRQTVAEYAQRQLSAAYDQVRAQASDIVDVERLVRNGPGSANYQNWAGSDAANEFSAGSAVLYANFLDQEGHDDAGLAKALYLCAPVLRTPKRLLFGLPGVEIPAGLRPVLVKAGGWPTGNKPTLSKLVHPPGLQDEPFYGRGANSSGMVLAPPGALALGDYVVETAQQVMEAQNYFDTLLATREGRVRATWPTVDRWGG